MVPLTGFHDFIRNNGHSSPEIGNSVTFHLAPQSPPDTFDPSNKAN